MYNPQYGQWIMDDAGCDAQPDLCMEVGVRCQLAHTQSLELCVLGLGGGGARRQHHLQARLNRQAGRRGLREAQRSAALQHACQETQHDDVAEERRRRGRRLTTPGRAQGRPRQCCVPLTSRRSLSACSACT